MELFTAKDFRVFDISTFEKRMQAIRTEIRPKLAGIGEALSPALADMLDQPVYAHVAKHARRTVNPPDDTWVALGPDKRGYKKDVHFKVAVSRHSVRLLFEVGPEYYDKREWALGWNRNIRDIANSIGRNKKLAWFKNEHDEVPQASGSGWPPSDLRQLAQELLGRREGQLVIGRRIAEADVIDMRSETFKKTAVATFRSVAPLFSLHALRRAS